MGNFLQTAVEKVRDQVGSGRAVCGLSGGVDSTVAAASEPGRALLRYVGPRTDTIIVLGYAGRARARILHRVLRSARCPVLIIPTRGFCP